MCHNLLVFHEPPFPVAVITRCHQVVLMHEHAEVYEYLPELLIFTEAKPSPEPLPVVLVLLSYTLYMAGLTHCFLLLFSFLCSWLCSPILGGLFRPDIVRAGAAVAALRKGAVAFNPDFNMAVKPHVVGYFAQG